MRTNPLRRPYSSGGRSEVPRSAGFFVRYAGGAVVMAGLALVCLTAAWDWWGHVLPLGMVAATFGIAAGLDAARRFIIGLWVWRTPLIQAGEEVRWARRAEAARFWSGRLAVGVVVLCIALVVVAMGGGEGGSQWLLLLGAALLGLVLMLTAFNLWWLSSARLHLVQAVDRVLVDADDARG
jgi:hypothetical protein